MDYIKQNLTCNVQLSQKTNEPKKHNTLKQTREQKIENSHQENVTA